MTVEIVNRRGLAGPASQTEALVERPYTPVKEWPANPKQLIELRRPDGTLKRVITSEQWHKELGINNRAGT